MFKVLTFLFVIPVTLSFGSDFETEFTRLISENSDPEQQLYGSTYQRTSSNEGNTLSFSQKVDHFKSTQKATWEQRVMILSTHYEKPGPFFLYFFGNEPASMNWLRNSQIMKYAKDAKALVIAIEHRFYGESRPFTNTSTENLNLLNVQQALSDAAYFINTVNGISLVPTNTKWIAFGGFYGGSLAAWSRMKYPHLVHGAVASSPIISAKSDFPEYLETVKNAYYSYDLNCSRKIEQAFQQLNKSAESEEGRAKISKQLRLCSPLENNEDDITVAQSILVEIISIAAERNHDDQFSMRTVCDIINYQSARGQDYIAYLNSKYLSVKNYRCWYGKYKKYISLNQEVEYERRDQTNRCWMYQSCTQLGLDTSYTKSVDMFGEYKPEIIGQARICQDIFGSDFTQKTMDNGVEETNIQFGAFNYNTSRVIFVYGTNDPWKHAGITEKPEYALYDLIRINGASHRADLEPSSRNNDLENGIRQIKDLLKSWLA